MSSFLRRTRYTKIDISPSDDCYWFHVFKPSLDNILFCVKDDT